MNSLPFILQLIFARLERAVYTHVKMPSHLTRRDLNFQVACLVGSPLNIPPVSVIKGEPDGPRLPTPLG